MTAISQQLNNESLVEEAIDGPANSDLAANQQIQEQINKLNNKWSNICNIVDKKRDDLNSTFGVKIIHIESQETISWIQDKIRGAVHGEARQRSIRSHADPATTFRLGARNGRDRRRSSLRRRPSLWRKTTRPIPPVTA